MLESIGEVGAPCGKELLKQQIWARIVETVLLKLNGLDLKRFLTLPKWMDPKKSEISTLKIYFLPKCLVAFVTMLLFFANPCADGFVG